MAFQRTCVGVDLGSHSIKVVHLKITEKGAFLQNALYFDRASLGAMGVDIENRPAVAALLKSQMSEGKIPTRGAVLGISGNDSILRYTAVPPVPSWRLKVIMEYEVADVSEKVGEKLASDYRVLSLPRETGDDQVVLVALAKEQELERILSDFESAGVYFEKAVPTPIALCAAYDAFGTKPDPDSPDDELVVVADIGRSSMNTALVLNERIIFARSASFGGEKFTEAIARDLDVDATKAEQLKLSTGTVDIEARESAHHGVVTALRGGAVQVQNLIESSLRFCRTQTGVALPEPTRIVLVGGASRLRGLDSYLRQAFKNPVEMFQPTGVIATGSLGGRAAEIFVSSPGDFSVALGLAVVGIREQTFQLDVMPTRYREARYFWERTIFMYVAAAFLLLTLLLGFWNGWHHNSRVDARLREQTSDKAYLQAKKVEMNENVRSGFQVRERINRALREIEVSGFQVTLLEFLSQSLSSEIRLTRFRVDPALDEYEEDYLYQVTVEGFADNSNDTAIDLIKDLEKRLGGQSYVATVLTEHTKPVGTSYEFRMVISPSFRRYHGY